MTTQQLVDYQDYLRHLPAATPQRALAAWQSAKTLGAYMALQDAGKVNIRFQELYAVAEVNRGDQWEFVGKIGSFTMPNHESPFHNPHLTTLMREAIACAQQ